MARLARAYTPTAEDREDLLQDILLQVWRSIPRFGHKASPSTWIYLGEGLLILGLVVMAALFAGCGIWGWRQGLPVQVLVGSSILALVCLAIAGHKARDRFRQMKRRPKTSDPIRACLEENLDWLRHEIWLWKHQVLWWYLLPLAVGELVLLFSIRWAVGGRAALLNLSNLADVAVSLAFVWAGRWFCRWYVRKYYEPRQRELESLLQSLQSC